MPRVLTKTEIKDLGLKTVREYLIEQGFKIIAVSERGEYYLVRTEKAEETDLVVVFTTTYPNRAEDHTVSEMRYLQDFAETNNLTLRYAGVSLIDIDAMSGVITDRSSIIVKFQGLIDLC